MEQQLLSQKDNHNLVIFFAGWSCNPNQFVNLNFKDHDLLIIYNYNNLDFQPFDFNKYKNCKIIAWSFGVWAAEYVMHLLPQTTLKIAINGTPMPIDDQHGIPKRVFNLTLRSIANEGIDKFNERMCNGMIQNFIKSDRSFDSQLNELQTLNHLTTTTTITHLNWDYSIIGDKDLIFPQKNMLLYWDKKSNFAPIILNIPHYPFTSACEAKLTELINFDR